MIKSYISTYLFILFALAGCSMQELEVNDPVEEPIETEEVLDFRILFIGNSLTYYHKLPDLVKAEGRKKDHKIGVKVIAYGNYALEDHWNEGRIQQEIRSGKYRYVVVQQGPSSQQYGRTSLLEYGEKLTRICDQNEAQLAFFMVWPSRTYYHTYLDVIKNYTDAADANDAILCPVGKVWKDHFDRTQDFSYYGPDGFHPSPEGTQVAAEVIAKSLF